MQLAGASALRGGCRTKPSRNSRGASAHRAPGRTGAALDSRTGARAKRTEARFLKRPQMGAHRLAGGLCDSLREKQKSGRKPYSLDYPCVVARNESGHLSDFRGTHESLLLSREAVAQRVSATRTPTGAQVGTSAAGVPARGTRVERTRTEVARIVMPCGDGLPSPRLGFMRQPHAKAEVMEWAHHGA